MAVFSATHARCSSGGEASSCTLMKLTCAISRHAVTSSRTSAFSTRLDVNNVTNATGLLLTSDYVAAPQLRRNYTLTFAADL